MLEMYLKAVDNADQATYEALAWYREVVQAIRKQKLIINQPYGELKVVTIWDAGSLAWRPQPFREYRVIRSGAKLGSVVDVRCVDNADLLQRYMLAHNRETDAKALEAATYRDLCAMYLRGELTNQERESITLAETTAEGTIIQPACVRCYVVEPVVKPVKRTRK